MSQPFTFQAANNRSLLRIGQILFTVLAFLSFALGSVLLSLVWFGVGVTTTGKDFGADMEVRTFVFIVIWPAIMLAVWILSHHTGGVRIQDESLLYAIPKQSVWYLISRSLLIHLLVHFQYLLIILFYGRNSLRPPGKTDAAQIRK